MNNSSDKSIFINGKKQIIDMLRFMDESERRKLLNNIRMRNASAAKELSEQSFSFKDLSRLTDDALATVFRNISAPIVGLALNLTSREFQRRVLSLMERNQAEKAYHILIQDLSSKRQECTRAQQKVIEAAIELSRRNIIRF